MPKCDVNKGGVNLLMFKTVLYINQGRRKLFYGGGRWGRGGGSLSVKMLATWLADDQKFKNCTS